MWVWQFEVIKSHFPLSSPLDKATWQLSILQIHICNDLGCGWCGCDNLTWLRAISPSHLHCPGIPPAPMSSQPSRKMLNLWHSSEGWNSCPPSHKHSEAKPEQHNSLLPAPDRIPGTQFREAKFSRHCLYKTTPIRVDIAGAIYSCTKLTEIIYMMCRFCKTYRIWLWCLTSKVNFFLCSGDMHTFL